jgi:hypothetical protein
VRVVGFHEDAVASDGDAAVRAAAGRQTGRARAPVAPDLPSAARVEGIALVDVGDVHDSANHDRRHLQIAGAGEREHPRHPETRDGVLVDLGLGRVAVAAGRAVVGRPVDARRHFTESAVRPPQQVHALVRGPQLQIVEPFADDLPVQRRAGGGLDLHPLAGRRVRFGSTLNRAQVLHQVGQFGVADLAGRHALGRLAVANQLAQLLIVARAQA